MKKNIMIFALLFAILVGSFYLLFMRFQLAFKIDTKSYVFTSNKIIENLYVNGLSGEDVHVDFTMAEENEQVYKQGNKYFIGETEKEQISIEYPMLSEDGSRVSNLGNYKILITEDFKMATTFDNAILSEGALYNATSMDRVDKENYFLFNVQDKVYLNATKLTIDLGETKREIPMNSIVYFMEHEIRYYFLYNDTFLYDVITGIEDTDTVSFFNSEIGYRDMLLNLQVIVEIEDVEEFIPEQIIPPVRDEEFVVPDEEYVYIKPEATTEIVSVSVYSLKVNLALLDNARRIETSPTYEIKYNGRTFLRKTLYSTGTFEITGLLPDTEFEIEAYFTYRNEYDKLIKKTMLTTTIKTKDISTLEPIKLTYKNDNLYSNKLEFNEMQLMNNKTDEVLKGIKDMEAYINGERYIVSGGVVQKLKKLQVVDYETPPTLKSNTLYDVEFVIYDIAGNKLVVENNITKSRTLKSKPSAEINITGTDLTYFDSRIEIINPDEVNMSNLIYVITDNNNNIITQEKLESENIHVGDLDINSVYNIYIYADYDLEDGNGVQKNVLLKQGKVTTKPLSTLGFVRFTLNEEELTQHEAKFNLSINNSSTDKKLLEILDKIHFTVKVKNTDEVINQTTIEGDDVVNLKSPGSTFLLEFLGLYSNTYYKIEVTTDVKQGSKIYNIKGLLNITEFSTLKQPATVDIVNQFTNESLIDFDVKITDLDRAIETSRVILYVRDSSGTLVSYKNLPINGDYERLTFDKLNKEEKYTFTYLVGSYNLGYTNATYEEDKVLLEKTIETKVGIYGSIQLESLLKQITSDNLFDIDNNRRWKKEGDSTISDRTIDNQENTITLSVKNGYGSYSYYLPERKSLPVRISFYARHTKDSNMQSVYLSNGGGNSRQFPLSDISTSYKFYTFEMVLKHNGYFGFYIDEISNNNTITTIQIKDLMVTGYEQNDSTTTRIEDSYHSSNYIFTDTKMIGGNKIMPSYNSGTMEGNSGHGYARITRLSDNSIYNFSYTGNEQTFTVPSTDDYKIQLWGASGHGNSGRGAYTEGKINLKASSKLYVYVGQNGYHSNTAFTSAFNGGATGSQTCGYINYIGGGATDVRLTNGKWDNEDSLKSRIMVAAGGGANGWGVPQGGDGGELYGNKGGYLDNPNAYGRGASQVSGGLNGGTFGKGGAAVTDITCNCSEGGGGGGGYYGGGGAYETGYRYGGAGGGGSSYISGHLGCIAIHKQKTTSNQTHTDYSEKSALKGIFYVDLVDSNKELDDPHFYIEMVENGVVVDTVQYEMDEPHSTTNTMLEYEFSKNKEYEMVLNVKIRDRLYPIAKSFFTTDEEIRTIRTIQEFFDMHLTGKYLVGADLDFREVNQTYPWLWFSGKIDFQGYKILLDTTNSANQLIPDVSSDALLSNMDVHYYLNNESARSNYYGLFYDFRGRVTNLKITVHEATNVGNVNFSLMAYVNNGTIENFVINNKAGLSGQRWTTLGPMHNYGTLKNGYVYGANINGSMPTTYPQESKRIGALAGYAASNSRIENVFSLIGIDGVNPDATENYSIDNRIGSLVGEHNRGIISNAYTYTSGSNRELTRDANIGNYGSVTAKNMYYVSDQIYNSIFSLKVAKLALKDPDFQNIINEEEMFNIEDFVPYGYYPQIKWPDCMPNQEYISLPSIDDADLIDITNVKETKIENNQTLAVLMVNNPSNEKITSVGIKDVGTVEIVDQVTQSGKTTLTIKLSNPLKYVSKYYVKTLSAKSAYGKEYTRTYADNERVLLIDMYRPINNEQEWLNINTYPDENFILTRSLDFENMPASKFQITNARGIINGNDYSIRNLEITVNDGLIRNLYGKFINTRIENVKRTRDNSHDRFGVVGYAYTSSVIDNVHVKDITIFSYNRMGGLVGYADGAIIRNSSVTNVTTQSLKNQIDVEVGGLIGEAYNMAIDNCYVQNANFDVTEAKVVNAVGGLIGYIGSGDVANVYATGTINTNSPKAGGLMGYNGAYVRNTYTNVDITSKSNYVGGISGTGNNIANSLSVGSVYSYLNSDLVKRIAGNADTPNNNYAWANQHVNGKISGETNGELLLTNEELADPLTYTEIIRFTDDFSYTNLKDGVLPKLKYTDGSRLLPYQLDNKLATYQFELLSIETSKSITDITVQLKFNNPDNYNVTGIKVDDMIDQVTKKQTVNGVTTIEAKLTPEKAFDSYKLSKIFYIDNEGNNKTYNTDVKLETQFYKDLEKYEDWQKISQEYAENYRLVADIDFAGKANVNYNVLINRLEGTGDTKKVLKNIDISVKGNDQSLINNILSNINNVEFNNITITNTDTSNVSRNGLILYTHGNFSNVDFKNITLNMAKANYVAPISFERTTDFRDVYAENITVKGRDYVGGVIARAETIGVTNITSKDVTINATGSYIGGIIGYGTYYWTTPVFHLSATDVNVTSSGSYVGGIFGYGGGTYLDVTNATIRGASYVGAAAGQQHAGYGNYTIVRDSEVTGTGTYIGGIAGYAYNVQYSYVLNTKVNGTGSSSNYTGGLVGGGGYSVYNSGIQDSIITTTGSYVGGIKGMISWSSVYDCYSYNTTITGNNYVGGIVGIHQSVSNSVYRNTTNATVIARNTGAGGILGYAVNEHTDSASNRIYIYQNISSAIVTAGNVAGGLVGRMDKLPYDGHMYSNVVIGNVTTTNTGSKPSIVIGSSDFYSYNIPNLKVFNGSMVNGVRISTQPEGLDTGVLIDLNALKTQSTYTNIGISTSYFTFDKLSTGYLPYNRYQTSGYHVYMPLPTGGTPTSSYMDVMRAEMALEEDKLHLLPTFDIYASDINAINIEFSDKDPLTTMTVNGESHIINHRVYTFNYDFKTNLEIKLSDGVNEKVYTYEPKDLQNKTYVNNNLFYLLKDNKVVTNNGKVNGKVVNIYENKALREDGMVISLDTKEALEKQNNTITLRGETKPLFTFEYNDNEIKTYYNYSTIDDKIINSQIFVKNGNIEMINGGSNSYKQSVIIDNYNEKNYFAMLSKDGNIFNLKDKIKTPNNFDNAKIVSMSNNLTSDSSLIAILYENGGGLVFDYRTGAISYKEYKNTSNLVDYYIEKFNSKTSMATFEESISTSYENSKDLIKQLEETSIKEVSTGKDIEEKNSYISVYNDIKKSYDVYDVTEIVNDGKVNAEKLNSSVNDEIYKDANLSNYYNVKKPAKESINITISQVIVFAMILVGILYSVIVLGKNITKKTVN